MLPTLILLSLSSIAAAVTLPASRNASPDSSIPQPLGPRDLFNRQSSFRCSSGYFCYSGQTCCGIGCCFPGYSCTSYYTCEVSTVSSCSSSQETCGTGCCNSGYYCATDLNCYPKSSGDLTTNVRTISYFQLLLLQ